MKILFLSLDRGLLGETSAAGAVKRHLFYIPQVEQQTIIVYSPDKYRYHDKIWHERLEVKATGGQRFFGAFKKMLDIGKRVIQNERYDLIVAQDPFFTGLVGYWLKKKFKKPLLIDLHGDFFGNREFLKESLFNIFLLLLAKYLIKKADLLRPVNFKIKDKLINLGIAPEKIMAVPTPVDAEHFKNPNLEKLKDLQKQYENQLVILFVGRLSVEKNVGFFLEVLKKAAADFSRFKFLVIGDGPKRRVWLNQTRQLGLGDKVEFLGAINQEQLPAYYHLADICVLPSTSESLGKVLMEAAMAKTAVLASKTLGAQLLIKDGVSGLLFDINNKQAAAAKLLTLLTSQNQRLNLGQALYEDISTNYNYQQSLNKVLKCWQMAAGIKQSYV